MLENNQKIKLLKIIEFLRAESNFKKPASTSQIIGYLNSIHISCERRTLYKDMDMLIESGANIIKTELGRENAYYIDEISFSLAEVKTLIDAVQAANFVPEDKTAELVEKLLSYTGVRRSEIIRNNIIFYNNHKHSNEDIYENIEQIELAIRHKKQVRLMPDLFSVSLVFMRAGSRRSSFPEAPARARSRRPRPRPSACGCGRAS